MSAGAAAAAPDRGRSAAPSPRRTAAPSADLHLWYVVAGLLVVLGCLTMLGLAMTSPAPRPVARVPAPPPRIAAPVRPDDPAVLLNNTPLAIAPADALALNAARAVDRAPLIAARPFLLPPAASATGGAGGAALDCLTQAVFYEAASESDAGQRAVAQVVLNRVRSPIFPQSVCGVVFQGAELPTGCQFSFTCDGSLARRPSAAGWARARRIAAAALKGTVERSVGLSTHYHADYVVPYWAASLNKVETIGAHIFYTMRGSRGQPAAFRAPYDANGEAVPTVTLDAAALAALSGAAGGDALAGRAGGSAPDRTVVAEDALGAPSAPAPRLGGAETRLRADEGAGQLVADAKSGVLEDGRR